MRIGAVPPHALHVDVDTIHIGQGVTGSITDRAGRGRCCGVMECQRIIRFRKARVQAVLDHRERAKSDLFGRLQDHDESTLPLVFMLHQKLRSADKTRHVRVMPTRMHDPCGHSTCRSSSYFGSKRQTRLFDHGKTIHICAQEDCRAFAVLHYRYDTRFPNVLGNLETQCAHTLGQLGRCFMLFETQFRVGVKIPVKLHQFGHVAFKICSQIVCAHWRSEHHCNCSKASGN